MCHSDSDCRRRVRSAARCGVQPCRAPSALLALVFVFSAFAGVLSAQNRSEEYLLVKNYALPEIAVPADSLEQEEEMWTRDGLPFSGLAFETFNNGRLSRVMTLMNGLQDGPTYLWYPTGAPQMYANYRAGRLHGRFLGWYMHGGVIYDMVINDSGYAGDYIEDDGSRAQDSGGDSEPDADGQDFERD